MSGRPPGQIFKNAWAAFGYMGSAARNCQQGTETTLETLLEGSQGAAVMPMGRRVPQQEESGSNGALHQIPSDALSPWAASCVGSFL